MTCIYIFTWVVSREGSPGTCGPDGSGDFAALKSAACVFLVGNMHMISREAAGLIPEAVVSYIQEKEGGRKEKKVSEASIALFFFLFFFFPEGGIGDRTFFESNLEECKTCLLNRSLPPSLMFLPPLPCYMSAPCTHIHKHRLISLSTRTHSPTPFSWS